MNKAEDGLEAQRKLLIPIRLTPYDRTPKLGFVISFHISDAMAGAVMSGSRRPVLSDQQGSEPDEVNPDPGRTSVRDHDSRSDARRSYTRELMINTDQRH